MRRFGVFVLLLSAQLPPTLSSQARPKTPIDRGRARGKCGPLADHLFQCAKFGFSIRVPFGWVERTDDMNGKREVGTDGTSPQAADPSGSKVLLAVFSHPPEVVGNTINSAIVIAAESLANYPQIKSAADYFGPVSDLAQERGFNADGDPYDFAVGSRRLIRGDFSREQGNLTMRQSSLVMVENHCIISFTFIGGSDQETDDLIDELSFSPGKTK